MTPSTRRLRARPVKLSTSHPSVVRSFSGSVPSNDRDKLEKRRSAAILRNEWRRYAMALAGRGIHMATTQDEMIAELQRANAELRQERDTARAERDEALAQRDSDYGERIEHQSATIDVLRTMSASPGDAQPVFELIAERARDICGGYGVRCIGIDGSVIHLRAYTGVSEDPAVKQAVEAVYPMLLTREVPMARAIMDRRVIRIDDFDAEPGLSPATRGNVKSAVAVPMMRGDAPIGGLIMGAVSAAASPTARLPCCKLSPNRR